MSILGQYSNSLEMRRWVHHEGTTTTTTATTRSGSIRVLEESDSHHNYLHHHHLDSLEKRAGGKEEGGTVRSGLVRHDVRTGTNVPTEDDDEFWQRNWKCGVPSQSWAKTIAVIDIVKGTFGLIFAAYLAVSIFRLMAITPDFDTLKRRMSRTHFIFIFAIGKTGWGVVLFICGLAFWNFFLIVFGKILFDAATMRDTGRLRAWYFYCVLGILVSVGLYIRMWLTSSECAENYLCREQQFDYWDVWIVIKLTYLFLFVPTVYTLAVVQSFCSEISPPPTPQPRRLQLSARSNNTTAAPSASSSRYNSQRRNYYGPENFQDFPSQPSTLTRFRTDTTDLI